MSDFGKFRADWIVRCAAQYMRRSDLSEGTAHQIAIAAFDMRNDSLTPEESADEDIDNWDNE